MLTCHLTMQRYTVLAYLLGLFVTASSGGTIAYAQDKLPLPDGTSPRPGYVYLAIEPKVKHKDTDLNLSGIPNLPLESGGTIKGTRIVAGPPVNSVYGVAKEPMVVPLEPLLKKQGRRLPPVLEVIADKYKFFLVTFGVHMVRAPGEEFERVVFQATFEKESELSPVPSTLELFPETEWQSWLKLGFKGDVAVSPELKFIIPSLLKPAGETGATAIFHFEYEWRHPLVQAAGKQDTFCLWDYRKKKKLVGTLQFFAIVKAPRQVQRSNVFLGAAFLIDTKRGPGGVYEYSALGKGTLDFAASE